MTRGKIVINFEGDFAQVEMWKEDECSVTCAKFTTLTEDILRKLMGGGASSGQGFLSALR